MWIISYVTLVLMWYNFPKMKRILHYLNPMGHLGERKYSVLFPLFVNLVVCILSEVYCYGIARNPLAVGLYIIFVNVVLILFFLGNDVRIKKAGEKENH